MTDISPTPDAAAVASAPELVACAHCGHRDSGTYCSACGKELVEDESRTVAHEVWELLVVDRLNDAKEYATTTWYLLRHPLRFFATVLARPAARAGHVFPEPAPQPLPKGVVQRPVTFYLISFVTALLLGKVLGIQAPEVIPGLDDDFANELMLLLVVVTFALYGVVFRWMSGRRISTEEVAVLSAYTIGASAIFTPLSLAFPSISGAAALAGFYLVWGIPLLLLPRMYGMSRRRVLLSQGVAACGAFAVLVAMIVGLQLLTGTAG